MKPNQDGNLSTFHDRSKHTNSVMCFVNFSVVIEKFTHRIKLWNRPLFPFALASYKEMFPCIIKLWNNH